jgi:hypothetical protein
MMASQRPVAALVTFNRGADHLIGPSPGKPVGANSAATDPTPARTTSQGRVNWPAFLAAFVRRMRAFFLTRKHKRHLARVRATGSTQAIGRHYRDARREMTERLKAEMKAAGYQ